MVGPRPFLVKSLGPKVLFTEQLFTEFRSVFVCKVSVGSGW